MKKITKFTCPKMALRIVVHYIIEASLLFLVLLVKYLPVQLLGVFAVVLSNFMFIKLNGYGASIFRSFIRVRISEKGISNAFCKIKWEEIQRTEYEYLEIKCNARTNKYIRLIAGKYGLVLFVSKIQSKEEITFNNYSLKNTICMPFDENIKKIIEERRQAETVDDSEETRNCPMSP